MLSASKKACYIATTSNFSDSMGLMIYSLGFLQTKQQ